MGDRWSRRSWKASRFSTSALGCVAVIMLCVVGLHRWNAIPEGRAVPVHIIREVTVATGPISHDLTSGSEELSTKSKRKSSSALLSTCEDTTIVFPQWPESFEPNISAVFLVGEQKSATTWLWEMLSHHPCLMPAAQPAWRTGSITTKESYYFTSTNISADARAFLVPWLGYQKEHSLTREAVDSIDRNWLSRALAVADVGTVATQEELTTHRSYTSPAAKVTGMQQCNARYLLEATPHNLHTPIAAARMKAMFPEAKVLALLKDPVERMKSAYSQFSKDFHRACDSVRVQAWCPVYRYYRLKLPTFPEMAEDDIRYVTSRGCAFQNNSQSKTWMECFGCELMDPWKYRRSGSETQRPPYAPSLALSMYAPMLEAYFDHFEAPAVRVLNYEALVADVKSEVNGVLAFLGLEEYGDEQWNILAPERMGFKGSHADSDFAESADVLRRVESTLYNFFKPLNSQLEQLLAAHNMTWQPFQKVPR